MRMEDLDFSDIKFGIDKEDEIKARFLKRLETWRMMKNSLINSPRLPYSRMDVQRTGAEKNLHSFLNITRTILGVSDADFFKVKQKEDADFAIGDAIKIKERFIKQVAELVLTEESHSTDGILSSSVNEARRMLGISDSVFSGLKSQVKHKCLQKKTEANIISGDWLKKLEKL